jgi:hypothetical protein
MSQAHDEGDDEQHHSLPQRSPLEVEAAGTRAGKKGGGWLETFAGVAGNVLEWYDFAVFGFFSDVIADVFFPPQEGDDALMESFVVFGGAFLMRPSK